MKEKFLAELTDWLGRMKVHLVDRSRVTGEFVKNPSTGRIPNVHHPVSRTS